MVLGVCRQVLGHAQDAEDAFQATFLILARGPASIRKGTALPSWLYGVAHRLAGHARRAARRRVGTPGVRNVYRTENVPGQEKRTQLVSGQGYSGKELRPLVCRF
jgi:DNA-directed RNA polymerase specialized sigma24 family protein